MADVMFGSGLDEDLDLVSFFDARFDDSDDEGEKEGWSKDDDEDDWDEEDDWDDDDDDDDDDEDWEEEEEWEEESSDWEEDE